MCLCCVAFGYSDRPLSDGGSVDTTTGTISTFLLNMVLHPEVQEKGRAEIHRAIGPDRLPAMAEYDFIYVSSYLLVITDRYSAARICLT